MTYLHMYLNKLYTTIVSQARWDEKELPRVAPLWRKYHESLWTQSRHGPPAHQPMETLVSLSPAFFQGTYKVRSQEVRNAQEETDKHVPRRFGG